MLDTRDPRAAAALALLFLGAVLARALSPGATAPPREVGDAAEGPRLLRAPPADLYLLTRREDPHPSAAERPWPYAAAVRLAFLAAPRDWVDDLEDGWPAAPLELPSPSEPGELFLGVDLALGGDAGAARVETDAGHTLRLAPEGTLPRPHVLTAWPPALTERVGRPVRLLPPEEPRSRGRLRAAWYGERREGARGHDVDVLLDLLGGPVVRFLEGTHARVDAARVRVLSGHALDRLGDRPIPRGPLPRLRSLLRGLRLVELSEALGASAPARLRDTVGPIGLRPYLGPYRAALASDPLFRRTAPPEVDRFAERIRAIPGSDAEEGAAAMAGLLVHRMQLATLAPVGRGNPRTLETVAAMLRDLGEVRATGVLPPDEQVRWLRALVLLLGRGRGEASTRSLLESVPAASEPYGAALELLEALPGSRARDQALRGGRRLRARAQGL